VRYTYDVFFILTLTDIHFQFSQRQKSSGVVPFFQLDYFPALMVLHRGEKNLLDKKTRKIDFLKGDILKFTVNFLSFNDTAQLSKQKERTKNRKKNTVS